MNLNHKKTNHLDAETLQKLAMNALDDVKGQDIQAFDTTQLSSVFERVIICSGNSNRQTRALAKHVVDAVRNAGGHTYTEGENTGEWVLVDLGSVVVHIMQPMVRAYYQLEELWGEQLLEARNMQNTSAKTPHPHLSSTPMATGMAWVGANGLPNRNAWM